MNYDDKLLTPTKKYLVNVANFWDRCRHFGTNSRHYWSSIIRIRYLQIQKKANNKRYKILKDKFFTSVCFISRNDIKPEDIPNINFNPLQIEKHQYYNEGIKHLNKDVKCFSERFKNLEDKVKQFNTILDKFQNDKLIEVVKKYLEENGFTVSHDLSSINHENTVITVDLIPRLKISWKDGSRFNLTHEKIYNNRDVYKLNIDIPGGNHAHIATVTSNNLEKIKYCINCFRYYHPILKEYVVLKNKNDEITTEAQSLVNDIQNNIISKIDIGDYKTTCNKCGWFNFLHLH